MVYDGYLSLKSTLGDLRKVVVDVGNVILGVISGSGADVAKKARDLSDAVHGSVGPSLSRASEELPKIIQVIPGEVGKAADGAKNAVTSHWEWAKKEVERRRK